MRALLLLVLMLGPSLPWAAELGDAPLGSSCRGAADAAVHAGAEPKYDVERMLQTGFVLLERGQAPGEHEQILYRCSGSTGIVVGYSAELSTPSEAAARKAYATALHALQGRYGRPTRDSERLSLPQRMLRWRPYAAAFTADESSAWTSAPQLISVTLQKQRTAPEWEVITSDQPAMPSASVASIRGAQLISGALLVALCSTTVVSALLMMPHVRYRWVIALGTPLALTYELSCTNSPLAQNLPGRAEAAAATWSAVWFICGAAASALIAWRWRQRAVARVPAEPVGERSGRALMAAGMALFAILGLWMWGAFQPPHDPGALAGVPVMDAAVPITVVLATLLTVVGTGRLLSARTGWQGRLSSPWSATALLGVLGSIAGTTLCVNILADLVLAL